MAQIKQRIGTDTSSIPSEFYLDDHVHLAFGHEVC